MNLLLFVCLWHQGEEVVLLSLVQIQCLTWSWLTILDWLDCEWLTCLLPIRLASDMSAEMCAEDASPSLCLPPPTHTHTHTHTRIHAHTHHIYVCMHAHTHELTYACTHTHMYICIQCRVRVLDSFGSEPYGQWALNKWHNCACYMLIAFLPLLLYGGKEEVCMVHTTLHIRTLPAILVSLSLV